MIHVDYSSATTLEEAHNIDKLSSVWGENLQSRCNQLQECVQDPDVNIVSEFGVYRGSSLIPIVLCNPKKVIAVDVQLKRLKEHNLSLIETYAQQNNIEIELIEAESIDEKTVRSVDFLHIDSLHKPDYLKKELELHSKHVSKYIMFHDIKQNKWQLWKVIKNFIEHNPHWKLKAKYEKGSCGYAVIERIQKD